MHDDTGTRPALQAVILDYDGVIANTEPLHLRVMDEALAVLGQRLTRDQYYEQYLGLDDDTLFRTLATDRRLDWTAEMVTAVIADKTVRFAEHLDRACAQAACGGGSLLFPAVAARLREWSAVVPIAIASGSLPGEIEQVLAAERVREAVSVIVASGETRRGKPFPDPYLRALERLAALAVRKLTASQCVAIEDSPWGIESAHGAGLVVVAVATSYPSSRLGDADLVVERFEQLDLNCLEETVCNRSHL
jgi:beta-phosphoglucomutase